MGGWCPLDVNIDAGRAALVIGLCLAGVILINLVIYYMVANRNNAGQVNMLRKAANRVRDPWKDEDESLLELSKLVGRLKNEAPTEPGGTELPVDKK